MKNPTITNRNTGVSWKYSGPFSEKSQNIYVLDFYGKIVNIYRNGHGYFDSTENHEYEVTFDIEPVDKLESWLDYDYKEIAYLFNQSISDIHKIQNRKLPWKDPRVRPALKSMRIQIDQVREKVKIKSQLTHTEQKIYDMILSRYRTKTTVVENGTNKSIVEQSIEILYGDYWTKNLL